MASSTVRNNIRTNGNDPRQPTTARTLRRLPASAANARVDGVQPGGGGGYGEFGGGGRGVGSGGGKVSLIKKKAKTKEELLNQTDGWD